MMLLLATLLSLPLVEAPSPKPSPHLAVVISGDGGWAKIDRAFAQKLNERGVSVVGLNSLQYFWKKKSPEIVARDVERIIETYAKAWKRERIILIGYSRGADVLPFVVNRFPPQRRAQLALVALIAPSRTTDFELHLADFFRDAGSVPVTPELDALRGRERVLCVYGADEDRESACTAVEAGNIQRLRLTGGHHFDGAYAQVAKAIADAAGVQP